MHKVPPDAKRLPPEVIASGFLDRETALQHSWTTVAGNPTRRVQTEEGMGKGQTHYEVTFQCPRCEEDLKFHNDKEHGQHPVRCHCDATLVFTVAW